MSARTIDEIQDALDSRYARFGVHPLTDGDVWALSMAAMVMPDGNPGAEGYLAKVAGTPLFDARLTLWGRVVAIGIAGSQHRAKGGHRRVTYVPSYDETWGRYAVDDGLSLAINGKAEVNAADRVTAFGCGRQAYERIRDFVGGAMMSAIAEYQVALQWATGSRRDRVLAGRWEGITGLSWSDSKRDGSISGEGSNTFQRFAPGCARIDAKSDADDTQKPDPETVYHSLRPSAWWDEAHARQARKWPVTKIYPATV